MKHVLRCKPSAPPQSRDASFILMTRPADMDAFKAASVISQNCLHFCLNTSSNGVLIFIKSITFIMVSLVSFTRLWMSKLWGVFDIQSMRFLIWEGKRSVIPASVPWEMYESMICFVRRMRFVCYFLMGRFINITWHATDEEMRWEQ